MLNCPVNPNTSAAFWCNTSIHAAEEAALALQEAAEAEESYMLGVAASKLHRVIAHMWAQRASTYGRGPYNAMRERLYISAPRNPATAEAAWYGVQRTAAAFGSLSHNCRYMRGPQHRAQRQQHRYILQWIAAAWVLDALYFGTYA